MVTSYGLCLLILGCSSRYFEAISRDTAAAGGTDSSTERSIALPSDDGGDDPGDGNGRRGPAFGLLGYAAVAGLGVETTTGGAGDPRPVTVRDGPALQQAIDEKGEGPLTVFVEGRLIFTDSGRVHLLDQADVSIIGLDGGGELDGFGITLENSHNIVIQNLRIHHVERDDGDAIRIAEGSHHVWIDHCELYNDGAGAEGGFDGLIDITRRSDYVTVSWSHIRDSRQGLLVGHSDDNRQEDEGAFHVTYHHNLVERIGSGGPSVRFGRVHIWNSIFRSFAGDGLETGVAVSARMNACVLLENNLFEAIPTPVRTDQSGAADDTVGFVDLRGNRFEGASRVDRMPVCTLDVPYEHAAAFTGAEDLADDLRDRVGVGSWQQIGL